MNREMRRQLTRVKEHAPAGSSYKPPRLAKAKPMLHEVNMVFAPIDGFLTQLSQGQISCTTDGVPVFADHEGALYEATPAVRGFISAFNRILDHYRVDIDLTPVIRLCNKLDVGMPLTEAHVQQCQALVDKCRAAYRQMDLYQVKSIVNTELIDIELQRIGHEAKAGAGADQMQGA